MIRLALIPQPFGQSGGGGGPGGMTSEWEEGGGEEASAAEAVSPAAPRTYRDYRNCLTFGDVALQEHPQYQHRIAHLCDSHIGAIHK